MQGHGAVGDVVAEPAGEEGDLALGGLGVLFGGDEGAVVAEGALEAFVDFGGDVGLQADLLRRELNVGMLGLGGGEGADVVVTAAGQGADEVGVFEVDEMLGGLGGVEFLLGGVTPAVGLGTEVLERVERGGVAQEGGNVRGEVGAGDAVDHRWPSVPQPQAGCVARRATSAEAEARRRRREKWRMG